MNTGNSSANATTVYKILTREDWQQACQAGSYAGSRDDLRDGFVHLSAAHQVGATAARHFRGIDGLTLVALDAGRLGAALKWEPSRGGDLFPHHYGALPVSAAVWSKPIELGADGVPLIPEDLEAC